ncbi:NADPH-dependent FMN reductase [Pseudogracilibacillus sp. SE30717A]|uniref:NADPH-dependent FMN reductase n=1 Tax=Pseudogracilibacillus sp. SE30717A TaxID=3098293 RepID=UPI00300DEF03
MSNIVLISGSPSLFSRSNQILSYLGAKLKEEEQFSVSHILVNEIPLEDLFYGKYDSETIKKIAKQIQEAKGVIIASPVYKASYPGVLKALLDILPQDIFKSKPVFPIMTGGSPNHLLAIEYTLKPLISILKGHSLQGVYILDSQINTEYKNPIIDDDIKRRIELQIGYFIEAIREGKISIPQ